MRLQPLLRRETNRYEATHTGPVPHFLVLGLQMRLHVARFGEDLPAFRASASRLLHLQLPMLPTCLESLQAAKRAEEAYGEA